jgi:hypothetical protein
MEAGAAFCDDLVAIGVVLARTFDEPDLPIGVLIVGFTSPRRLDAIVGGGAKRETDTRISKLRKIARFLFEHTNKSRKTNLQKMRQTIREITKKKISLAQKT